MENEHKNKLVKKWKMVYLVGPRQRRNPSRRYRSMGRIWFPSRCVPECRNRSFRWQQNCRVSTRIHAPVEREWWKLVILFTLVLTWPWSGFFFIKINWHISEIGVSFVCKSISDVQSKRLLQIERRFDLAYSQLTMCIEPMVSYDSHNEWKL